MKCAMACWHPGSLVSMPCLSADLDQDFFMSRERECAKEGAVIADVGVEMKSIAKAWRDGNLEDEPRASHLSVPPAFLRVPTFANADKYCIGIALRTCVGRCVLLQLPFMRA